MGKKPTGKPRRRREGYLHKSPAICVVIHDPTGRPMPDNVAAEILNNVTQIAISNGFLINFTRT
jgi:hypothetical protein